MEKLRIRTKKHSLEEEGDNHGRSTTEPVSPTGQYFNSSALSISVLSVLEFEVPIDDSCTFKLLEDVFLPINPRFSSIMVVDEDGVKQWKQESVSLQDHIYVPTFPPNLSPTSYDQYFSEYLSKIAMDPFPQDRPLWSIHIIKYPTSDAAGYVVFKLHHALGDGFTLTGALLSCLQRADDPSLPLTLPRFTSESAPQNTIFNMVPKVLTGAYYTIVDFGWSVLKSLFIEDDRTPIRSRNEGVEFNPVEISTVAFSLDQIKEIKVELRGVTVNDVVSGIIFLGTRLYMQGKGESGDSQSTALVLLNTRNLSGYKSIEEMLKPNKDTAMRWGNQFAFLHASMPELNDKESTFDPLEFVHKTKTMIRRKRSSLAVYLMGQMLETMRKWKGPEETAKCMHSTLRNSSITLSSMIGPVEQMSLNNHPIKGQYFMVIGVPQSLTITVLSYTRTLKIAIGVEKDFIDMQKYKSCLRKAFEMIREAASKK